MYDLNLGVTYALKAKKDSPFPIIDDNLVDYLPLISDSGYKNVEFHIRDPKEVNSLLLKNKCSQLNLNVSSIGTGMAYSYEGLSLIDSRQIIQEKAIQRLLEQIDLASIFDNCVVIIGSMRGVLQKTQDYETAKTVFVKNIKYLDNYAFRKGIKIVIENIDKTETNFLNNIPEICNLIKDNHLKSTLLHLDTFHYWQSHGNNFVYIKENIDFIRHIHVADSQRTLPGTGQFDFRKLINLLKENNYQYSLTLESFLNQKLELALITNKLFFDSLFDSLLD